MEELSSKELNMIKFTPKKAIIIMAIPLIIDAFVEIFNNVVDGIWVSSLGAQHLAATEFVSPLMLILIGIGVSLSAGTMAVMSRYVGKGDKNKASNVAMHSILLIVILSIIVSVVLLIFIKPILIMLGAGNVLDLAQQYSFFIVLGLYATIIPCVLQSVFLVEGKANHATFPVIIATIVNMLIDPIFIYTFNFGIAGAALSNLFAQTVFSLLPMLYWIFIKKNTLIEINFKKFKLDLKVYKDILLITIPVFLEECFISLLTIIVHLVLSLISTEYSIAVFSAAWRFVTLGLTPILGIGLATVSVLGFAYGAKNWDNFKLIFNFSVKISVIISVIVAVLIFIFAGSLAKLFASSDPSLIPYVTNSIRILIVIVPLTSYGVIATYYLQAVGKGISLLILTFFKEVIFSFLFVVLFVLLGFGERGVFLGVVVGGAIGALVLYLYSRYDLNKIIKNNINNN